MTKISEQRIFSIIGSLYDIAQQTASEPWVEVYKDIAELFGSGWGGLTAFDKRANSFSVVEGTTPKEFLDEYFETYQHISPMRSAIASIKPGERFNRQDLIDDTTFRDLPIYQEFYKKGGIFHLEYRVFLAHEDSHAGISFARPEGQPNFSENELRAMTYLMPHLARAFKLHFNLLDVHRQNRVISEAFDHIPQGVIVVDRDRKLVFANARGSELLSDGNGLKVDGKGAVNTSAGNKRFERLIADINNRDAIAPDKFGGVATVERSDGMRPLELLISPFDHEDFRGGSSESLAIIYVTDPEAKTVDIAEVLTQIYGLTPTEAKLAHLLAEGRSFREACAEMSITDNTGRTHLKRIFSKTDTNRQSALVKLILNGPANIRRNADKDPV